MKVYILDVKGKSLRNMLLWLEKDDRISGARIFDDYVRLIEAVSNSPPDFCLIRLGADSIPGMKTARMVLEMSPKTRIVFLSDDRDYALDAYEIGVYGYLLCPVEPKKFADVFRLSKTEKVLKTRNMKGVSEL